MKKRKNHEERYWALLLYADEPLPYFMVHSIGADGVTALCFFKTKRRAMEKRALLGDPRIARVVRVSAKTI